MFNSPSVLLCWQKEINPTPKHSLCANSWWSLCPYTRLFFFFFFPLPCAQFTCFHSNSECTVRACHTQRGGAAKQTTVECVQASLALMMTNAVQKSWQCNCYKDHLVHWYCKKIFPDTENKEFSHALLIAYIKNKAKFLGNLTLIYIYSLCIYILKHVTCKYSKLNYYY